jgi:hypothetical protein
MKIKYHSIIFVLFALFSACQITDTVPKDAITDLNYWKKPDDLKLFANNLYTTLATTLTSPSATLDNQSDNVITGTQNTILFNTMAVPGSNGGWASGDWTNIRNCNYFLSHYQTVVGAQVDINQYLGEIQFFRATEYFYKVRRFGDLPWIDKDLTVTDSTYLMAARAPMKTIVDHIITDLTAAITNLKTPDLLDAGRINKYAAMQMLARVCLYEGTYLKYRNITGYQTYLTTAATTTDAIMATGKYDIVKATAPYIVTGYPLYYKQQFIQEDLTANKECIMPRIYTLGLLLHGLSRTVDQAGSGASKDFAEDFLCTDGLPIALSPLYQGDDSVQMEMTNRDPRMRNILDNKNLPYYLDGSKPITYPVTPVAVNKCPTGYMVSKFRDPVPAQNEANQSTSDWYYFRYAEVLLINAEAKAELGTIAQADLDKTINKLRSRLDEVGKFTMGTLTLNPPVDPLATVGGNPRYGYAVTPLIYEIRRERRIELAFEGFRWDDICRWNAGKLIENPKTMLGIVVNIGVVARYKLYNGGTDQFASRTLYTLTDWNSKTKTLLKVYTNTTRTWVDKLYLLPLPTTQLTLNPHLTQNPGW